MALVLLAAHPWALAILPALIAAGILADWHSARLTARAQAAHKLAQARAIAQHRAKLARYAQLGTACAGWRD